MNYEERPLCFPCRGAALFGILALPERPRPRGVLIAVGGPQYRAGSHRQFVLLARALAAHGYPVLRFDYRGMGDSHGAPRSFEQVDDDLRAAVDQLFSCAPMTQDVAIWGLCDGASAALLYAHRDTRIVGLVLANPWARTEEGEAKARLKHYYQARLLEAGLWDKIMRGDFDYGAAARSLWTSIANAYVNAGRDAPAGSTPTLPDRLFQGLARFKGEVLFVLSENDLTAQEFNDLATGTPHWRRLMAAPRVRRLHVASADHTFSRRAWREQIVSGTCEWLDGLPVRTRLTEQG